MVMVILKIIVGISRFTSRYWHVMVLVKKVLNNAVNESTIKVTNSIASFSVTFSTGLQ